jgi:hypothetical protein
VSGSVAPAIAGASVLLETYYLGAWHIFRIGALSTSSTYSFPFTLTAPAAYRFRLVKLGAGVYTAFTTTPFTITVG